MKKLVVVILLFTLIGCHRGDKVKNGLIKIDALSFNDIDIEKLFGGIRFLSIDKNERILPGAAKIIYQYDCIYLSDGYVLYTYDRTGKMINCIDKKGRAGGEYLGITDFDVSENRIAILDRNSKKVLFYDHQGAFLFDVALNLFASTFVIQNDSLLVLNNDYSYDKNSQRAKLTLVNIHTKEVSYFGAFNANKVNYMHILRVFNFYKNGNDLFFHENFNPVVYRVENGAMVENIRVELPDMPQDDYYDQPFNDVLEFITSFNQNGYASGISKLYCSENKLLFEFNHKQKSYYCSYNTKMQQVDFMGELFLYDDLKINDVYFRDTKAIASISAYRLIEAAGKNKKIADLVDKYGVTEESSPLLILIENVETNKNN